jgi:hypothetical protein
VLLAVTVALASPSLAVAGTEPPPERCERADGEPGRCVGPVTDESGGGGDVLTIALGVVVGLAIAGVAFVLVRRQLAKPSARPAGPPRPRTPS